MSIKRFSLIILVLILFGMFWSFMFYTSAFAQDDGGKWIMTCYYYEYPDYYEPINWAFITMGDYDPQTNELDNEGHFKLVGNNCGEAYYYLDPIITGFVKTGCGSDEIVIILAQETTEFVEVVFSNCEVSPARSFLPLFQIVE